MRQDLPEQYRNYNQPLMETVAYNHATCGDKRQRLFVTRTATGWMFHCHNCAGLKGGLSGFMKETPDSSPRATLRKLKGVTQAVSPVPFKGLPEDYTEKLPPEAIAWLSKYNLTDDELLKYGIGYSPHYGRIVLPIYDGDSPEIFRPALGWQGRDVRKDGVRAKYMTYKQAGKRLIFDSFVTHCEVIEEPDEDKPLVFVEDIISAIKVGRVTRSIAILGSYISDDMIALAMKHKRVLVWLDDDKYKESQQFSSRLRGLGIPTVTLTTNRDPKELPMSEIERMVLFP